MEPIGKLAKKPEYVDWLAEVDKIGGEFSWIRKTKDFPKNATGKERTIDEINQSVLNSYRVKKAIKEESLKRDRVEESIRLEAEEILYNMAHSFNMSAVRTIGYGVVKVIKHVFDKVLVNMASLRRLREILPKDPVVFVPTHKTYVDFMLVSLLCFDQDVTLPAIAAGSDFQNSKIMGEALRRCGAFFIRRSFGNDQLYWAIFAEYLQTHIKNADRPVEFFVEGTRSRTSKSLYPKYGLLQCLLEPFLKSDVYDLQIVPVTMNYDKILEESLYAYELLGFPKPKESTSGLLKARQILNKRFGNVYMTFGEPISARRYFQGSIDRSRLSIQPDMHMIVPDDQKKVIRKFGHEIIRIHNAHNVITLWPLACIAMLEIIDDSKHSLLEDVPIKYYDLRSKTNSLLNLCEAMGIQIQILNEVEEDLKYFLNLHSDLFVPFNRSDPDPVIKFITFPIDENGIIQKHLLQKAVTSIILSNYANQALDAFSDASFVSTILKKTSKVSYGQLLFELASLHATFQREFIRVPGETQQDLDSTLTRLVQSDVISREGTQISVKNHFKIEEMAKILMVVFSLDSSVTAKNFVATCQKNMARVLEKNDKHSNLRLAFLSNDLVKNAYAILQFEKVVVLKGSHDLKIDMNKLLSLMEKLKKYTEVANIADTVVVHSRL